VAERNTHNPGVMPSAQELFGLKPELVTRVVDALETGNHALVRSLVSPLTSADVADLLEPMRGDQREALVELLRPDFDPEILAELDETVREQVVEQMGAEEVAAAITELDSDDAVEVIEDLEEEVQLKVLEEIPEEERAILEDSLAYPEESAGRLMQRELVAVPTHGTVGEIIDFLRSEEDLPDDFYDLFVVDPRHHPVGSVPLSRVLRSKREKTVEKIMDPSPKPVSALMDQEEVAFLFRRHDLISAPVVDGDSRLVGVITIDDVVDVIDEEAGEDILRLGGVAEEDFYGAVVETTQHRFTWLLVNLGTAFLASLVIFQFEDTIAKFVALAVLMPIVASMGGNAGTQTLTVAVRALAMKELTRTNALRAVGKELLVNGVNGVFFALITGLAAAWWFDDPLMGNIIAAAMIINLVIAGFAGIAVPLGLTRLGVDPAIASGTFVTTVTDVVGFLAFLGLAALFLV
jgi:magnesium transporter